MRFLFLLFCCYVLFLGCDKDAVNAERRPSVPAFEKFDLQVPEWMVQSKDSMAMFIEQCFYEINTFDDFYPFIDVANNDLKDASEPETFVQQPWIWPFSFNSYDYTFLNVEEQSQYYYFSVKGGVNYPKFSTQTGSYITQNRLVKLVEADLRKNRTSSSVCVYNRYNIQRYWDWKVIENYLSYLEYYRDPLDFDDGVSSYGLPDTEIGALFTKLLTKTEFIYTSMLYTTDGEGNYEFKAYDLGENEFQIKINCQWNDQGEGSWKIYDGEQIAKEGMW